MGINVKAAGFTIGGLTAIWLANKALNMTRGIVSDLAEAGKWKAYYKYGNQKYSVPPGYSRNSFYDSEAKATVNVDSPEQQEADRKSQEEAARQAAKPAAFDFGKLGESLERIAKAVCKSKGINLDLPEDNRNPARTTYASYYGKHGSKEEQPANDINRMFDKDQEDNNKFHGEAGETYSGTDIDGDNVVPFPNAVPDAEMTDHSATEEETPETDDTGKDEDE